VAAGVVGQPGAADLPALLSDRLVRLQRVAAYQREAAMWAPTWRGQEALCGIWIAPPVRQAKPKS
jgi:hypothetical protein